MAAQPDTNDNLPQERSGHAAAGAARPEFSAPAFAVELDFFSGPMDLLLHLVHQQEVPVEKVEMRRVAEQYLDIISRAKYLDLDRAMEYLVIAATLMSIKSHSLLPPAQPLDVHVDQPDPGSDFYDELRERLKQYELTKQRALTLSAMPQLGIDTFVRLDRKALVAPPEMLGEGGDAHGLGMIFFKLLKRIGDSANVFRVALEPISVVSFMMKIIDTLQDAAEGAFEKLKSGGRSSFGMLAGGIFKQARVKGLKAAATPRGVVIGSFIAMLELAKRGLITAEQELDAPEIKLSLRASPGALPGEMESEFDLDLTPLEPREAAVEQSAPEETHSQNGNVVHLADYLNRPKTEEQLEEPKRNERRRSI